MNRLLKVYLINIFKQKGFYICLGIELFFSVIVSILASSFGATPPVLVADGILEVLQVGIIPIIFITLFVCSDFTDGATKNFISRGYTRRQILYAKYIASVIAIFTFFIVDSLFAFIGFRKNGLGFDEHIIICIIGYLIASLAATGFYVIVSNTLEKLSMAITTNILIYVFVPALCLLADRLLKLDFSTSTYFVSFLTGLLPPKNATINDLLLVTGLSIGYLVLMFEISNVIIKKKEVK